MKRATVYASQPSPARKPNPGEPVDAAPTPRTARWKNGFLRHERWAMLLVGLAIGALQSSTEGVFLAMNGMIFRAGEVHKNPETKRFEQDS